MEARQNMLVGSMLAGQAFANAPVGAVHALAYPLGGHFHLSHGHTNALVLVEVLKFNAPNAKQHYAELMQLLDLAVQVVRMAYVICLSIICKTILTKAV